MKPELAEILQLPAEQAAPQLLGWQLRRRTSRGPIIAKIVETEAYHQDDPASHSFGGISQRTAPMFKEPGTIYVYFTYGMHYCFNLVCGPAGRGEAVLIRALEPLVGVEIMKQYRGIADIHQLTNGPAKAAQALGVVDTTWSGRKIGPKTLELLAPALLVRPGQIIRTPRIGIEQAIDLPLRFYIKDNPFVSKK